LIGWTPHAKVFDQLDKYWDTGNYVGAYAGIGPPSSWGLAECSNYQFLSYSTIFRENVGQTKYYFPQPDYNQTSEHIETEKYLWGAAAIDYKYISGYGIIHLARTKYIEKYAYSQGQAYLASTEAYHTTIDNAVFEDYAKKTVPRTIDFTTGLINYFFRGRLEVTETGADGCNIILTIKNTSILTEPGSPPVEHPQVLKGGTFELYWDDAEGKRTKIEDFEVTDWNSSSTLPYDGTVTAEFMSLSIGDEEESPLQLLGESEGSSPPVLQYVLVYRGTISEAGEDDDALDPDAIATAVLPYCAPDLDTESCKTKFDALRAMINERLAGMGLSYIDPVPEVSEEDVCDYSMMEIYRWAAFGILSNSYELNGEGLERSLDGCYFENILGCDGWRNRTSPEHDLDDILTVISGLNGKWIALSRPTDEYWQMYYEGSDVPVVNTSKADACDEWDNENDTPYAYYSNSWGLILAGISVEYSQEGTDFTIQDYSTFKKDSQGILSYNVPNLTIVDAVCEMSPVSNFKGNPDGTPSACRQDHPLPLTLYVGADQPPTTAPYNSLFSYGTECGSYE
jgi:hypothetical protein